MEELQPATTKVHDLHPSLVNLTGAIDNAKENLSKENREETKFRIVTDNIELFEDKSLSKRKETIVLEKNSIVLGKYLYDDNKHVFFLGDPYNVFCRSADVEPEDLKHTHSNDTTTTNDDDTEKDGFVQVQTNNEAVTVEDDNISGGGQQLSAGHEVQETTLVYGNLKGDDDLDKSEQEDEDENAVLSSQLTNSHIEDNPIGVIDNKETETEIGTAEMQRTMTETVPAQTYQAYSHPISVSAELPEMDIPTMNEYPSKSIKAVEDMRPSFIATLPDKEKSTEPIKNEANTMDRPINNRKISYHEQAKKNEKDNENYIVTTDKSKNQSCCVCL